VPSGVEYVANDAMSRQCEEVSDRLNETTQNHLQFIASFNNSKYTSLDKWHCGA